MGYGRGQRQAERSKQAIITAFLALLREQSYQSIVIQDITTRANTGRSTFYRYFPSKADVLVEMHKTYFGSMALNFTASLHHTEDNPSPGLIRMLTLIQEARTMPITFTSLGDDAEYVLRQISALLRQRIEEELQRTFQAQASTLPLPILAQAMTGIYLGLLRGAMEQQYDFSPRQLAETIQRLTQALLHEAVVAHQ